MVYLLFVLVVQNLYILWFRPEKLQQVNWAGNTDKPKRVEEDGSLTIFPRKSFELWKETVKLTSLPWKQCEIEATLEIKSTIIEIIFKKADELAAINLELERNNSELDAFAYITSHDLKEPLRGIHNYSTFLLEDYKDIINAEGVSKLETLIKLTKRMEDLINSLLHFSRLGRQGLKLNFINLNEILTNITQILTISQKIDQIDIRIPKTLPTILGDENLIEEVLINLISNALKYNDNTHKWVEVGFLESQEEKPSFWTFYVKDNGIGIKENHLDIIFRIFKRLHTSHKYQGGTGIGLTIVKKIIELHGGKVWVQSIYGQGSTFYFTIPIAG